MATEDGYFLGRQLARVNLSDYTTVRAALDAFEIPRKPHTARQVQQAFILGKVFHHAPAPLRPVRDVILDRTPFLQKVVGESSPGEILAQISAINEAEQRFAAVQVRVPGDDGAANARPHRSSRCRSRGCQAELPACELVTVSSSVIWQRRSKSEVLRPPDPLEHGLGVGLQQAGVLAS